MILEWWPATVGPKGRLDDGDDDDDDDDDHLDDVRQSACPPACPAAHAKMYLKGAVYLQKMVFGGNKYI